MHVSVRATNVYEESSLGIYPEEESKEDEVVDLQDTRVAIWGKHFMRHVRRQLSFGTLPPPTSSPHAIDSEGLDMWWLALTVFLLSVIEVRVVPQLIALSRSTYYLLAAQPHGHQQLDMVQLVRHMYVHHRRCRILAPPDESFQCLKPCRRTAPSASVLVPPS